MAFWTSLMRIESSPLLSPHVSGKLSCNVSSSVSSCLLCESVQYSVHLSRTLLLSVRSGLLSGMIVTYAVFFVFANVHSSLNASFILPFDCRFCLYPSKVLSSTVLWLLSFFFLYYSSICICLLWAYLGTV